MELRKNAIQYTHWWSSQWRKSGRKLEDKIKISQRTPKFKALASQFSQLLNHQLEIGKFVLVLTSV